jgi:NAD(P)-dependent dehydrogenase (short-subunit alcohol dehydrogenase family)
MPALLVVGVRGLGGVIARHFAEQGWQIACAARTAGEVEALAAQTRGTALVADLRDRQATERLCAQAWEKLGRVDLVVAAQTSGARFGPQSVLDLADFERALTGYPQATLHLLQAAGPRLIAQGGGSFLQMGTGSGLKAREGFAGISAAQAALRALCAVAALELKPRGVHVAYVAIEGGIEREGSARPQELSIPPLEIARAVEYLHGQAKRAWTHELSLRPAASP